MQVVLSESVMKSTVLQEIVISIMFELNDKGVLEIVLYRNLLYTNFFFNSSVL